MNTRLQKLSGTFPKATATDIQKLYDRYAAMLLGYIYDVVKDDILAEKYLADTFIAAVQLPADLLKTDENIYCKLQLLAREQMAGYFEEVKNCDIDVIVKNHPNKYLSQMNRRQLLVFCSVHYHGKTTAVIAAEMNEGEDVVRKLLKEAFVIIRNSKDAGVH